MRLFRGSWGVCKWASVTARPHNFVRFMKSVTVTGLQGFILTARVVSYNTGTETDRAED